MMKHALAALLLGALLCLPLAACTGKAGNDVSNAMSKAGSAASNAISKVESAADSALEPESGVSSRPTKDIDKDDAKSDIKDNAKDDVSGSSEKSSSLAD